MKKLIVLGFACALAGFASASEIYWQVNKDKLDAATEKYGNWKLARLVATTGDDVQHGGDVLSGISRADLEAGLPGSFEIDSKYSGYNFFVELVNSNNLEDKYAGIAAVGTIGYDTLKAGAYEGGMGMPPSNPYSFNGDFVATPEPTTGMLFVLGVMALGLKRKKEIV